MNPPCLLLTGASGSGKTTIVRALAGRYPTLCTCLFFDSIGVPSQEEMLRLYGSTDEPGGAWQRAMTYHWLQEIAPMLAAGSAVLLEGQMRIAFIDQGAARAGIRDYYIVLVDCDDATRTSRLSKDRNQPELAHADMMNWAKFLRAEAVERSVEILDTTTRSIDQSVEHLAALLRR